MHRGNRTHYGMPRRGSTWSGEISYVAGPCRYLAWVGINTEYGGVRLVIDGRGRHA